jgi:glycine/D-amino acid oxidase-like deaminating enzyme
MALCPALQGDRSADVVVIGGGFMGLSTALKLAERGVDVIVIEASQVGWGASGRNNGLVVPGLKRDPDDVRRALGVDHGDLLLRFAGNAPATVYALIDEHHIDCDLNRGGWVQAAHTKRAIPVIEKRVREWQDLGADVELIEQDQVSSRLGTGFYVGAWFDPRGGSLNPLAYARGLARAAQNAGVTIVEATPATDITNLAGRWAVHTPGGIIQSEAVVSGTNAYGDLGKLRGTVIPLRTAQIASAPLPAELTREILPGGESASDTQRLLTSFRLTRDNRLIMGGADATAGDHNDKLVVRLQHAARERFPGLGEIPWEYGWSGYLALTHNHLPQIMKVDGGFYAGIGCNGRGIAMATATGLCIAGLLSGESEKDCPVPICRPRRIAGYGLRYPGVAVSVVFNRLLDRSGR